MQMQQLVTLGSILFCNCYLFDWFAGALFFYLRNTFIRIWEERAASGLRAVDSETTTTDSIFWPSNLAIASAPGRKWRRLFADQDWSWLMSGCRKMKYSNGTQTGKMTGYQRQLCLHLYRDLSPPWHPRWSCCTWQVGHVLNRDSAGRGEVDSVFTWLMLGTYTVRVKRRCLMSNFKCNILLPLFIFTLMQIEPLNCE